MKIFLAVVIATFAMLGSVTAQGTPANDSAQNSTTTATAQPNAAPPKQIRIAPGSVIPVQLTKTIDAKKLKTGDEVSAQVTEDMKTGSGEIIVPKNTKIIGKVTEAQARNKQEKESQIGIAFDQAVMKDGANMTLPLSIQAVIAPSYLNPNSNGASDQAAAQSSPQSSPTPGGGITPGGRSPGMQQPQAPNAGAAGNEEPTTATSAANPHPRVTGSTQGVLGIQHLTLSSASTAAQGSVLTSDKNNVKLEGGTLLLLRVNK
ncbi:MAG TPA: hypothetical protein VMF10_02785 [Candidatus Aquilonibacter sp.]|nr:hypothetical protein [Candidatus Aquilonibacter sp.]